MLKHIIPAHRMIGGPKRVNGCMCYEAIDYQAHKCVECGTVINPNEKYCVRIIMEPVENKLPRLVLEDVHIDCLIKG